MEYTGFVSKLKKIELKTETINGKRFYITPEGNRYPSVTTILSVMIERPWLQKWKEKVGEEEANRIAQEAAQRGSSMHSLIEKYFLGENIQENENEKGYKLFKQLESYLNDITPIGIEVPMWSDRLKVAGRTDCLGIYDGDVSIIDFKTSKRTKTVDKINDYFLQASIYSMMALERFEIVAKKIVIIIATDKGTPQVFKKDVKDFIPPAYRIIREYHSKYKSNSFI